MSDNISGFSSLSYSLEGRNISILVEAKRKVWTASEEKKNKKLQAFQQKELLVKNVFLGKKD